MILNGLDLVVVGAYFLILIGFGVIVRRLRTFSDYAVGGRAVPVAMIFASLSATYIGPGYTMGFAAKGFSMGWLFLAVVMGFTIQTLVVSLFVAPRLHRFTDCFTVGDVIGKAHGKVAHLIAGVISILLLIGFAAIMAKVGGLVVQGTLGWPMAVGVFVVTGVGVLYCFTGGLPSVIATEALQFAIFAVAIPILLWLTVSKSGVDLAKANADAVTAMRQAATEIGPLGILGLFVSFLLGETLIPPYANRALASGSPAIARVGFLAGAAYSVVWFGMVVAIGVIGRQVLPGAGADDVFMAVAAQYLPHGLLGLLVIAVIAIIMSSQESVLNAGAVSLTRDVRDVVGRPLTDRGRLRLSRVGTLVLGLVAGVLALHAPTIIDGLLIIYSVWAPSVLPVLLLTVVRRGTPARAAGAPAMLAGAAASLAWQFALGEPRGIPAILVGLTANLLVYGAVSAVARKGRGR